MAEYLWIMAGLIGLTVGVNEMLKALSGGHRHGDGLVRCRECGVLMNEVSYSWAYQLPFEMWAVVAKYNFKPQSARRFLCVQKHTMTWYLPPFGDRGCEMWVTKSLRK